MRLFLTFITTHGNEDNLRELVEPVKHLIDGVVATFHYPKDDGAAYLESVKGAGKIVYREWVQRHDLSMNETLWAGVLKDGDYVCVVDTLERPIPSFLTEVRGELATLMETNDIDCISYFGKPYIFRFNEYLRYQGSPHWGLQGLNGKIVEYRDIEPDETKVRFNARPTKRTDPMNWVTHYAKYFLYPPGSNHALLGLDTYGDPAKLFTPREVKRLQFRQEMRRQGYETTMDGLKAFLLQPLTQQLKDLINSDKVWADYYQYEILGNKNVVHSHDPKDMIKVS